MIGGLCARRTVSYGEALLAPSQKGLDYVTAYRPKKATSKLRTPKPDFRCTLLRAGRLPRGTDTPK